MFATLLPSVSAVVGRPSSLCGVASWPPFELRHTPLGSLVIRLEPPATNSTQLLPTQPPAVSKLLPAWQHFNFSGHRLTSSDTDNLMSSLLSGPLTASTRLHALNDTSHLLPTPFASHLPLTNSSPPTSLVTCHLTTAKTSPSLALTAAYFPAIA